MGIRRRARETALQFLFQDDFLGKLEPEDDFEVRFAQFCQLFQISKKAKPYALTLIGEVKRNRERIDSHIDVGSNNWRLSRLSVADRNILRVAVCEMIIIDDVPGQVAINEAVEIAKKFGRKESSSFVNGVLDAIWNRIR